MAQTKRTTTTLTSYTKDARMQLPLRILIPLIMDLTDAPFEYHYGINGTEDKLCIDYFDGLHYNAGGKEQQLARRKVYDYIHGLCKDLFILSDE